MQLADQSILSSLKASGRLPSPTGVALQILELTRDPDTSTEDMAEVLQADPALAGQLLKYANRVEAGARGEIRTLNEALVRLGMSTVRQLCLGFSIISNARRGPCVRFNYQHYWAQALATAVSCQALARRILTVSPDSAFTCGLLASIGQLALASVYPEEYAAIIADWDGASLKDLGTRERTELSIDHNQVTAALFEDWRLPDIYRFAVLQQDDGDLLDHFGTRGARERGGALAALLNIASVASQICLETGPERHILVMEFMRIGEKLAVPEPAWIAMYDEILAEWARVGRVLDIVTSKVPSLEELLQRARDQRQPIDDHRAATPAAANDGHCDGEPALPTVRGLRVLLVCARESDVHDLQVKLAAANHEVTVAADGTQALELALQLEPELVLTAVDLPGMDGLELCRTLRRTEQTRRTFLVVVAASGDPEAQIAAFEAGANDCITLSVDERILAARLSAAAFVVRLQEKADGDQAQLQRALAELGTMARRLEHAALEDQLTEVPNRRAGLQQLDREWARVQREDGPLLVMLLDIDHFKRVNDTFGHDIGDVVLRETARVTKETMRKSDTVCRFGGEEFLVICPDASVDVAMDLGDRIRERIEANVIEVPGYRGAVTVSLGAAARCRHHVSPKDLIREADEALYAAKQAGRNKVCISSDE